MRRLFLLVFLTVVALSWSQVEWQENGIPVRQGVNIEWFRSAITLEDGGCVYTWSDTRYGDRDAFAQRIDAEGNLVWGAGAALVNGEINRQEDIVVMYGNGDETIYAWVEFRNEDAGDIYAQKLDGDGNMMWDPSGVPLCLAADVQISLNIVTDNAGGAYIIWLDSRNPGGPDIYGTHLLADGTIAEGWQVDGSPIISINGNQTGHTFWEDGEGGAIVIWTDTRDGNNQNLYMQRMDWNGNLLWDENGTLVSNAPEIQESAKICPDGTGCFILSWVSNQNDTDGDIYANRINLDGDLLWGEGIVIYEGTGIQRNPRVTEASNSGAFVTWEDGRSDPMFKDIYVQKLDTDGNLLWTPGGVIVVAEENDQLNPRISGDSAGGCWIIWDDGRLEGHPHEDIYIQHFNSNGVPLLEASGRAVCDAVGEQFAPLIKMDNDDQIYLSWGDNRLGSTGLYHQLLDAEGNDLLEDNGTLIYYGLCGDALNAKMCGNGDQMLLFWRDTRYNTVATQIYMQVLNNDGSFDLIEDGVPITEMTGADHGGEESEYDVVMQNDEAAIAWVELRGLTNTVFAQLVDLEGNHFWGDLGLPLSDQDSEQKTVQVSADGGEYYFGWADRYGSWPNPEISQICAQKVVNGQRMWGDNGVIVGNQEGEEFLMDMVGRYFIWKLDSWPDIQIFINYLTEDGEVAPGWPQNGLTICDAPFNQLNAQGIMTDQGILVVWEDMRNSEAGPNSDIYGQIFTEDGSILWESNGAPLVSLPDDQYAFEVAYHQGYIYLVWSDFRNADNFDIYMQKYDMNGNEQWQTGGIEVIVKDYDQANATFTFYNDNIVVYWDDVDGINGSDLFMQMFNLEGERIGGFPQNGYNLCSAIKNQGFPEAVIDNDGFSYVIWNDFRSSGKTDIFNIYAQKLENYIPGSAGNNQLDDPIAIGMINHPNPFHTGTMLSFAINNDYLIDASVSIYNTRGQKVRTLPAENSAVYWDGRDENGKMTATGIYMYKLESKYFSSQPAKMIRMK